MELIRQELVDRLSPYGIVIGRGYSSFMFSPFYGFNFQYRNRQFRIFYNVQEETYSLREIIPTQTYIASGRIHINNGSIGNICNFLANIGN